MRIVDDVILLWVVCVKLSAGKSKPASSRLVDKQLVGSESGSSVAVSSSQRQQRQFGKSSRKRPAEVFVANRIFVMI